MLNTLRVLLLWVTAVAAFGTVAGEQILRIGGVVDGKSRTGREQRLACELAVENFCLSSPNCSISTQILLQFFDTKGNPLRAPTEATGMIAEDHVQVLLMDTVSASDYTNKMVDDAVLISLSSVLVSQEFLTRHRIVQMATPLIHRLRCQAAIVGYFKWRKVTALYETSYDGLSVEPGLITLLSDEMKLVNSEVAHYVGLPSTSSPTSVIEDAIVRTLNELKQKSNRVFVVMRCSLELGKVLFSKANELKMMDKDYAWIVSEEIGNSLESVNYSVSKNMEGVIALRAKFDENGQNFVKFKRRFRKKYAAKYPLEEEHSSPSIVALRAYDATWAVAQARQKIVASGQNISSKTLAKGIIYSNFEGLSGNISFRDNELAVQPKFKIINVLSRGYRTIGLWPPAVEFQIGGEPIGFTDPIIWPGNSKDLPRGHYVDKPLKVGVPADCVFSRLVRVVNQSGDNVTIVTGFSIEVFKALANFLPYDLPYEFVPLRGTYDEMVNQVYLKTVDAFVGDTMAMADRFRKVDFTLPYHPSGVVMIVPQVQDKVKVTLLLEIFTRNMWLLIIFVHISIALVAALMEITENDEVTGAFKILLLWISIIFYAQGELKSNLSRLIRAPWVVVIAILAAYFNAQLTSTMTLSRLKPAVNDVEVLKRTNAVVACNSNSFIIKHLIHVVGMKSENVKKFGVPSDYVKAFRDGTIQAAFFIESHANLFLKMYCKGFTKTGTPYSFGGMGFVFPKHSPLVNDVSEAILRILENGEVDRLEDEVINSVKCTETADFDESTTLLGTKLLFPLLEIAGAIAGLGFMIVVGRWVSGMEVVRYILVVLIWALMERRAERKGISVVHALNYKDTDKKNLLPLCQQIVE